MLLKLQVMQMKVSIYLFKLWGKSKLLFCGARPTGIGRSMAEAQKISVQDAVRLASKRDYFLLIDLTSLESCPSVTFYEITANIAVI
jgi:hypothetical protein